MSYSVSKCVIQMGKLMVHIAENGHSYGLDCDEYMLVESVQMFLESVCGIGFNDQLLLCLDMKLESRWPLSTYKLPFDECEVFLFNRAKMRTNAPAPALERVEIVNIPDPTLPSSSHNRHPLDDASDLALKALPSYEKTIQISFSGCKTVVLATRFAQDGSICKNVLYCAKKAGVTHILKVGGAQAICAMAWGPKALSLWFIYSHILAKMVACERLLQDQKQHQYHNNLK